MYKDAREASSFELGIKRDIKQNTRVILNGFLTIDTVGMQYLRSQTLETIQTEPTVGDTANVASGSKVHLSLSVPSTETRNPADSLPEAAAAVARTSN